MFHPVYKGSDRSMIKTIIVEDQELDPEKFEDCFGKHF